MRNEAGSWLDEHAVVGNGISHNAAQVPLLQIGFLGQIVVRYHVVQRNMGRYIPSVDCFEARSINLPTCQQ